MILLIHIGITILLGVVIVLAIRDAIDFSSDHVLDVSFDGLVSKVRALREENDLLRATTDNQLEEISRLQSHIEQLEQESVDKDLVTEVAEKARLVVESHYNIVESFEKLADTMSDVKEKIDDLDDEVEKLNTALDELE